MFKARKVDLRLHPLTARLVQYKSLIDNLEVKLDPIVKPQIDKIVQVVSQENGLVKLKRLISKERAKDVQPELKKQKWVKNLCLKLFPY